MGRRPARTPPQRAADLRLAAAQGAGARHDRHARARLRRLRRPTARSTCARFERRAAAGAQARADGRAADAAAEFRAALALWRGPALPTSRTSRARGRSPRASTSCACSPLERRSRPISRAAAHAELIAELDALVAAHPLHERFRALQMLALYRGGRQADALEAYRAARTTLVAELGIEPGAALQDSSAPSSSRTPRSLRPRAAAPVRAARAAIRAASWRPRFARLARRRSSPWARELAGGPQREIVHAPPRWPARRSSTAPSGGWATSARRLGGAA